MVIQTAAGEECADSRALLNRTIISGLSGIVFLPSRCRIIRHKDSIDTLPTTIPGQ